MSAHAGGRGKASGDDAEDGLVFHRPITTVPAPAARDSRADQMKMLQELGLDAEDWSADEEGFSLGSDFEVDDDDDAEGNSAAAATTVTKGAVAAAAAARPPSRAEETPLVEEIEERERAALVAACKRCERLRGELEGARAEAAEAHEAVEAAKARIGEARAESEALREELAEAHARTEGIEAASKAQLGVLRGRYEKHVAARDREIAALREQLEEGEGTGAGAADGAAEPGKAGGKGAKELASALAELRETQRQLQEVIMQRENLKETAERAHAQLRTAEEERSAMVARHQADLDAARRDAKSAKKAGGGGVLRTPTWGRRKQRADDGAAGGGTGADAGSAGAEAAALRAQLRATEGTVARLEKALVRAERESAELPGLRAEADERTKRAEFLEEETARLAEQLRAAENAAAEHRDAADAAAAENRHLEEQITLLRASAERVPGGPALAPAPAPATVVAERSGEPRGEEDEGGVGGARARTAHAPRAGDVAALATQVASARSDLAAAQAAAQRLRGAVAPMLRILSDALGTASHIADGNLRTVRARADLAEMHAAAARAGLRAARPRARACARVVAGTGAGVTGAATVARAVGACEVVVAEGAEGAVVGTAGGGGFVRVSLDTVWGPENGNGAIFREAVVPLVEDLVFDGRGFALLAHGSDGGCGSAVLTEGSREDPGLVGRTVKTIFGLADELRGAGARVRVALAIAQADAHRAVDLLADSDGAAAGGTDAISFRRVAALRDAPGVALAAAEAAKRLEGREGAHAPQHQLTFVRVETSGLRGATGRRKTCATAVFAALALGEHRGCSALAAALRGDTRHHHHQHHHDDDDDDDEEVVVEVEENSGGEGSRRRPPLLRLLAPFLFHPPDVVALAVAVAAANGDAAGTAAAVRWAAEVHTGDRSGVARPRAASATPLCSPRSAPPTAAAAGAVLRSPRAAAAAAAGGKAGMDAKKDGRRERGDGRGREREREARKDGREKERERDRERRHRREGRSGERERERER